MWAYWKFSLQGTEALKEGKSAVEAVVAAIKVLEDSALTNAGRGSSLSFDGKLAVFILDIYIHF